MSERTSGDGDRRLIEAGMVLASELSLGAVLQRIVELAVDLTGARYGALGVLTPDGSSIQDFLTVGITPEQRAALGDPPTGHGLLGALTREARPLRIPDIGADPRSVGFPPNHPPMTSLLGARIIGRGTVFGNLYLTDKQDAEMFDEEDERIIVVLATQTAIAVENARLYDETERKGRELQRLQVIEERERIGKELHDGVIQSLFAVGMRLHGLASSSADAEVARRLEAAVEDVDGAIRDLRNLHLRSASRHPRRPPARSGTQGDGERVRRPYRRRDRRRSAPAIGSSSRASQRAGVAGSAASAGTACAPEEGAGSSGI
jgi:GAF domain-containing protein